MYRPLILILFVSLTICLLSCSGPVTTVNESWTLIELVTKEEKSSQNFHEVEVEHCTPYASAKARSCSAGTSSNFSASVGVGAGGDVGVNLLASGSLNIGVAADVGVDLGFDRSSGEEIELELPPEGVIHRYLLRETYTVKTGRGQFRSDSGQQAEGSYSFQASCSLKIEKVEQYPCPSTESPPTAAPQPTPTPQPTATPRPTATPQAAYPNMVLVPAGEFTMGSPAETGLAECETFRDDCKRSWFEDEEPAHAVYLDAFYIDQYEVTNGQYADFLNAAGNQTEGGVTWLDIDSNGSLIERSSGQFAPKAGYGNHPVVEVSWYGAQAYCEWADKRLPTEAEWEKAARGTDGRLYPWGNEFDGSQVNFCDTNCPNDWKLSKFDDGYALFAPVGSYASGQSPYGAYDMAGNVWEWVADCYDSDYYSQTESKNLNPLNNSCSNSDSKVVRGGSWSDLAHYLRAANRSNNDPPNSDGALGFRCVVFP